MTDTAAETKKPDVTFVRRFKKTGRSLGISYVDGSWFVFDRGDLDVDWSMHCGPYASAGDARQWIRDIVETSVR